MERLPDDVLLLTMEYLGPEDLLTCRLVCKRLGRLALHPGVWSLQSWNANSVDGDRRACRVLRLAPRLGKLVARVGPHLSLAMARCAVKELELVANESTSVQATLLFRNQEKLGRLRRVELYFYGEALGGAPVLFAALVSSPVLEKLEIRNVPFNFDAKAMHCTVRQPALKHFKCSAKAGSVPFVNFVLTVHATTLQVVDLGHEACCPTATSTVALLAGLPHLRELSCPLLPDMGALAASETLGLLTLHVAAAMRPAAPAAAKYLRRARHLQNVTLRYRSATRFPVDVGVDLVEALAWSCLNRVETLCIEHEYDPDANRADGEDARLPDPGPLIRSLPSLTALRTLRLDVFETPGALLLAVTPDAAPALRALYLNPSPRRMAGLPPCAHAWRHEDAVRAFLSANRSVGLHVAATPYCFKDERCPACALGWLACHGDLWPSWDWELTSASSTLSHRRWVHVR
ncbi:uncharacterized protein LOC113212277 isoform X2 [Frankliniella occidentalis]|uniref:Uncharacterized protein LOC113212277 isoform X2 n=1 Tax=Frankliniella occidentalis TaxID=133901 RepID=A0A9C6WWR4_FRAOC|nr:uncharacterized protein LOC113212277 isoform X2 [Frankliniella occidentalis]